jgi:hypothetical protein
MPDQPAKRLENVVDLNYDQENTKEPFTMAFVYPRSGSMLIKGALDSVLEYMNENLTGIYHYRLSHWRRGRKRGKWYIQCPSDIDLSFKETKRGKSKTYSLIFKQFGKDVIVNTFDSVPHEYIKDFELFEIGV